MLPEDCISYIISLTSPRDACRSSLVCPLFKCAIDSDLVWRKFLPHDYHQILSNSASAPSMGSLSKKQLFFHLLDHPILVDDGKMVSTNQSFSASSKYLFFIRNSLFSNAKVYKFKQPLLLYIIFRNA